MSILAEVKNRITTALRNKDDLEKNVFRCVLGDVQTKAATLKTDPNDDLVMEVIKKHVVSLRETIPLARKDGRDVKGMERELEILSILLPKVMSAEQIKAFFSESGLLTEIATAKSDGQAMGIAMKGLKSKGMVFESSDVKEVVAGLRNG